MRQERTRRGIRFLHGPHVLSELLNSPGPTHSIFDVLAAAVAVLSPAPRLALLGFAGGGMVAPLRALGRPDAVEAVDLDVGPVPTFRRVSRAWGGAVRVRRADARAFLARRATRYPCIIEDLSAQLPDGDVQKPPLSFGPLPRLIARRLTPEGVAVFNMFVPRGRSWPFVHAAVRGAFPVVLSVRVAGYENRILLAGRALPPARRVAFELQAALLLLGSRLTGGLRVRRLL